MREHNWPGGWKFGVKPLSNIGYSSEQGILGPTKYLIQVNSSRSLNSWRMCSFIPRFIHASCPYGRKYKKSHLLIFWNAHLCMFWRRKKSAYGRLHPGQEMTSIKLDLFCFAVKPLNWWFFFFPVICVCVPINTTVQSTSILLISFTCWTGLKQPLNLASKFFVLLVWCVFGCIWKYE